MGSGSWIATGPPEQEGVGVDEQFDFPTPPPGGDNTGAPSNLSWAQLNVGLPPPSEIGCIITDSQSPLHLMQLKAGNKINKNKTISNISRPATLKPGEKVKTILQKPPGAQSLFLEYVPVLNRKTNEVNWVRQLQDTGSNVDMIDECFAESLGAASRAVHPHSISTAHGSSLVTKEYCIVYRMANGEHAKAVFLGFRDLATEYPSYRIQVPEEIRKKYKIQQKEIFQPKGRVKIICGSSLMALFPKILHQDENIVVGKSRITNNLLTDSYSHLTQPTKRKE